MENIKLFPVFNMFYETIEIFESKTKDKKENEYITLELKKVIDFRNRLVKHFYKIEEIIHSYKTRLENSNLLVEEYKIKKSTKKLRDTLKKKSKRSRVISKYTDLLNVIQCFDRKTRTYSNQRNSCKRIKQIKEKYSKKNIRFKVKTFNDQTEKLKKTVKLFNNHTCFFLYEFPRISKKFNKIEYIKKY